MNADELSLLKEVAKRWQEFLDTSKTGYALGCCYENAGRFVLRKKEFDGSPLVLCHGEVFSPERESYHGHAWVEWGDGAGMIIDPSTDKTEPVIAERSTYYRLGKIDPAAIRRFEIDELIRLLAEHHDWGPWEEQP